MGELLIKSPVTSNGRDPIMGEDGKITYRETILNDSPGPTGTRATFEKINLKLPTHLKHIIEVYTGETGKSTEPKKPADMNKAELQALLDEKEIAYTSKNTKEELLSFLS